MVRKFISIFCWVLSELKVVFMFIVVSEMNMWVRVNSFISVIVLVVGESGRLVDRVGMMVLVSSM